MLPQGDLRARFKLKEAGSGSIKKCVATRELGRFAAVYRRLFGELPSETRQRRAPLTGVLLGCYAAHWGWLIDDLF
jgi:hypothetical protein